MQSKATWFALVLLLPLAGACSPASTAVKIGMYAVGKVVDDSQVDQLAEELMGQPPSAADAKLGARIDTWQDVNSPRQWMTYPAKLDLLNTQRMVVEETGGRIVAVEKVQASTSEVDLARKLVYEAKVKGKSRRECQAELGKGAPVLTLRSANTGQLAQLYDGSMIEGLGGQKYCVLRFGADGRCEKLDLVDVSATAGSPAAG